MSPNEIADLENDGLYRGINISLRELERFCESNKRKIDVDVSISGEEAESFKAALDLVLGRIKQLKKDSNEVFQKEPIAENVPLTDAIKELSKFFESK